MRIISRNFWSVVELSTWALSWPSMQVWESSRAGSPQLGFCCCTNVTLNKHQSAVVNVMNNTFSSTADAPGPFLCCCVVVRNAANLHSGSRVRAAAMSEKKKMVIFKRLQKVCAFERVHACVLCRLLWTTKRGRNNKYSRKSRPWHAQKKDHDAMVLCEPWIVYTSYSLENVCGLSGRALHIGQVCRLQAHN